MEGAKTTSVIDETRILIGWNVAARLSGAIYKQDILPHPAVCCDAAHFDCSFSDILH